MKLKLPERNLLFSRIWDCISVPPSLSLRCPNLLWGGTQGKAMASKRSWKKISSHLSYKKFKARLAHRQIWDSPHFSHLLSPNFSSGGIRMAARLFRTTASPLCARIWYMTIWWNNVTKWRIIKSLYSLKRVFKIRKLKTKCKFHQLNSQGSRIWETHALPTVFCSAWCTRSTFTPTVPRASIARIAPATSRMLSWTSHSREAAHKKTIFPTSLSRQPWKTKISAAFVFSRLISKIRLSRRKTDRNLFYPLVSWY